MATPDVTPRIYVACLASYNNGVLHGAWIDAVQDADEIRSEIRNKVLLTSRFPNVVVDCPGCLDTCQGNSPDAPCMRCKGARKVPSAEEYAIHDYEGFDGYSVSEYEDLDTLAELARLIEKHGSIYAAYVEHVGAKYASEDDFEDKYRGAYDRLEDYAHELLQDTGAFSGAPELLVNYFDYEAFTRDLELTDVFTVERDGKVHVFSL
jgi:antirestriction protein